MNPAFIMKLVEVARGLRTSDFIGLDVCLDVLDNLHADLGEKYRPCQLLRKMVAAGKLGRKNGGGFYEYRK